MQIPSRVDILSPDSHLAAQCFPSYHKTELHHSALGCRLSSRAHTNSRLDDLRCLKERCLEKLENLTNTLSIEHTVNVDVKIFLAKMTTLG